ncbi:DUF2867 domain-containing protein [Nocardia sp. NPDC059239]|uniref:DUF2867 domain-containing protein n=1 Tax=unclassified Nocardia TaxID=2637762 RepID=UPI0036911838
MPFAAVLPNRLPHAEHTDRPWRIHELAPDFRVQDVWTFRAPGAGPDDFPVVLAAIRAGAGPAAASAPVRFLFAVRRRLGALLGWNEPAMMRRWDHAWRQHDSVRSVGAVRETEEVR